MKLYNKITLKNTHAFSCLDPSESLKEHEDIKIRKEAIQQDWITNDGTNC